MSLVNEMVGLGVSPGSASAILGSTNDNHAASGSTTSDATLLTAANVLIQTASSNQGVRVPSTASVGDSYQISNGSGNNIKIYPPTGGKINNGSTDAAVTLATANTAEITRLSVTHCICSWK